MANTVADYVDGLGNKAQAIQWDDDPATLVNIQLWTKKAHVNRRGVLAIQDEHLTRNVGVGDWLVMDSSRAPQVFPSTNSQFLSTYVVPTP